MKIAVLGGSFNPVHIGHLALADEVCKSLNYDSVLFVPTYKPPHKDMNSSISALKRFEMVKKACEKDSRFKAEDCEIMREGISYTYDTICFLEQKYKDVLEDKIGLIMGYDLLPGFHLWYKAKELCEKCTIIVANRPSEDNSSKKDYLNHAKGEYALLQKEMQNEKNCSGPFDYTKDALFKNAVFVDNPPLKVSSTEIRSRIGEGKSFKYLVCPEVFNYIIEEKLYGLH